MEAAQFQASISGASPWNFTDLASGLNFFFFFRFFDTNFQAVLTKINWILRNKSDNM